MVQDFGFVLVMRELNLGCFALALKKEHKMRLGATHTVSLSEVREEARNRRKLLREKQLKRIK